MTSSEILVLFLSVALAIFLVLGIILLANLIIVAQKIKRVADTAERTANHFEGMIATMQRAAAPAMISKFILDTAAQFVNRNKKEDK